MKTQASFITIILSLLIMAFTTKPQEAKLTEVWASKSDLKIPESVCYDQKRNVLYVSNINGKPREKDNNGFISKMDLKGNIIELNWVDGLSAPKGMGVFKNKLYVTDIDELVEIDIEKGKVLNKYKLNGAKMLNDITIDSKGGVYFSDTDVNKIHYFKDGKIDLWEYDGLSAPNGLYVESDRLILASMGSKDVVAFSLNDKKKTSWVTEIGNGDGIVPAHKDGYYIVSEWSGRIFLITPDHKKQLLLDTREEGKNTADIEYIKDQKLLLVPTFSDNRVVAYNLEL